MIQVWKSKSGSEWISRTKPVKEEGKKNLLLEIIQQQDSILFNEIISKTNAYDD